MKCPARGLIEDRTTLALFLVGGGLAVWAERRGWTATTAVAFGAVAAVAALWGKWLDLFSNWKG